MPLSSKEMINLFLSHGWDIKKGMTPETIPHSKELKKGLEKALLKRLGKEGSTEKNQRRQYEVSF